MKNILTSLAIAFLTHASFVLAHKETDWKLVLIIFFMAFTAMIQNDYVNRRDDAIIRNKNFATENAKSLRLILAILWVALLFCSYWYYRELRYYQAALLLFVIINVWFYYPTRKFFPMSSMVVLAYISGIPAMLAFNLHDKETWGCLILFMSVFCIILGREVIRSIENWPMDGVYEKTLITEGRLNQGQVSKRAVIIISLGIALSFWFWPSNISAGIIFGVGVIFCSLACLILYFRDVRSLGRNILEIGVVMLLAAISIMRW